MMTLNRSYGLWILCALGGGGRWVCVMWFAYTSLFRWANWGGGWAWDFDESLGNPKTKLGNGNLPYFLRKAGYGSGQEGVA